MPAAVENHEVRVRGTVQGVGFRPTVFRLATACELTGEVLNDNEGVLIRLSGQDKNLQFFYRRLRQEVPPLAHIVDIETQVMTEAWNFKDFRIRSSEHSRGRTEVVPDASLCPACAEEMSDPQQRRYLYPFTNCTHCGPRLSIVQGIPYDRANTTMDRFALCPDCRGEYENPLDRRFHAQPLACHRCGPRLFIHGEAEHSDDALPGRQAQTAQVLQRILQALADGQIVALKGLGGFHLCCDASQHQAVERLRARKHRYAKPLALMSHSLDEVRGFCRVSALEADTLLSPAAPIVLLQRRPQADAVLSPALAPGCELLGFMLAYTPLHQLICERFAGPLVMTSGNHSGQPQIIDNQEAIERLDGIADLIVLHDRDIANRIDDSVLRCVDGQARLLRRARGHAPRSLPLPAGFEQADGILAYGAELKASFCLVQQGAAILSQHQGDLEEAATYRDYAKNMQLYLAMFELAPALMAHDRHPEYLSSKLAQAQADERACPSLPVQHHHAHIASVMVENALPLQHPRILGIVLDGLGYAGPGQLWGGEFLLADYLGFSRLAHFKPLPMLGGFKAILEPWRNTYAQLLNSMPWTDVLRDYAELPIIQMLRSQPLSTLDSMLDRALNCPSASSAGRLFDAVAAAMSLCPEQIQFEGQAAMQLEALANAQAVTRGEVDQPYPFRIQHSDAADTPMQLDPAPLWPALLQDVAQGQPASCLANRFHAGLVQAICAVVEQLHQNHRFDVVALSGGCLQNAVLLQALNAALAQRQLKVISNAQVPANDGGIALGQAAIAAAHQLNNRH